MAEYKLPNGLTGVMIGCLLLSVTSTYGQVPLVRNSLTYSSGQVNEMGQQIGVVWQVSKTESYNHVKVISAVRDLANAGLAYATEHGNHFPDLARELFTLGYITDPLTFYNPGDSNDPPTTINNDILNAANSSRISFDYFGPGINPFDLNAVLFQDNTPSNNFGLGRVTAYADGHAAFVPANPHLFQMSDFLLNGNSETEIYRPDVGWQPYSTGLPFGMRSESIVGPHRYDLHVESNITPDVDAVFEAEGYNGREVVFTSSSVVVGFLELRVVGSEGMIPLTFYLHFSGTASRESTPLDDSLPWSTTLYSIFAGLPQSRDSAYLAWTKPGLFTFGKTAYLEHRILDPWDQGYIQGHDSIFVRGVAQLTVQVPANVTGTMALLVTAGTYTPFTPGISGAHKVGAVLTELPTRALEQLIVFAPNGYEVEIVSGGPSDMLRTVLRGDRDLDEFVTGADYDAFEDAYSGPLVGHTFAPSTSYELTAFDFDGDADVDCADWTMFALQYAIFNGTPTPIAPCANDEDGDGIPDGDDDCGMTVLGTIVDGRGCPRGDFDGDGDIDLTDWTYVVACTPTMTQYPLPPAPYLLNHCWSAFDTNEDKQVQLVDLSDLQNAFTGSMP